jgi:hypothetical protein
MPAAPSILRPLLAATLVIALAGCGGLKDSKLNPFNWFKRSETRVAVDVPQDPKETRPLVESVLDLKVEPIPGGAIVRARGLPPSQGWWDAELVPVPQDDPSTLLYEFRLSPPDRATDVNVPRSREIDVAIYVSDYKLEFVSEIIVQGAGNARSARR